MKLLVVGNGGREHAFVWKLHRDDPKAEIVITGPNAGAERIARRIDVAPHDAIGLRELARREGVDFTIVGPEVPLAAGVADLFRDAGLAIFGPGSEGARLESSKAFAKRLMQNVGIPTAEFEVFEAIEPARDYARQLGVPCVIKASGLAAGKGAIVCRAWEDVEAALTACFIDRAFGEAGDRVVVEAFLEGEEASMIALTDGETLLPLIPSQDHKQAEDGDRGPNTGGMGAYAPATMLDGDAQSTIVDTVFRPLLRGLAAEGVAFSGCLYAGLMLTADGARVLEWNVRFGDPETQALLPLVDSDLLSVLMAATPGGALAEQSIVWRSATCVTVVAASRGYPGPYDTGAPIHLPAEWAADPFDSESFTLFHAGTRLEQEQVVTAGGRVLNITAIGEDIEVARGRAYQAIERIECPALRWRTDIGWREVARSNRA